MQGIAQAVWETDPHGAVTQDSPSWRASTGQTLEEWRGYGWLDAIHPEDRAQVERQWREAVAAGRGVDTEYRLRCASGGWRWTGVRTVPVHDDEGRILKWIGMNVDIHARKQAEAALRESERKYREKAEELGQIMEVVPAAIFVSHDPECREIFGNRLANEFYEAGEGENVSAGPVGTLSMTNLKRRFSNLKGRELSPFELPMQRAASKNSLLQNEEMVVSLPCGKSFTMLGSAAPLRNADGSVRGSVGAFLDISERKEAEAALEESRGLSEAILDSLKSSIAIIDRDGRITAVNAVWQTSREDCDSWLGVNYLSECERAAKAGDDLAGQALRGINEVLNGTAKDFSLEYPCDTPSGPLWFAMTVTPLSGRNSGVVIAHEDITERKQAEDRLRASEERYRGIFQNAGTGITITDLDGRFLSCNPAYTAMLGYTEAELRDLLCPEIVHPEDQETNNAEIRRLLAEEIPAFEMLNRYVAKDGAVLWAHRHVSLLRDAAGRPKNIISLVYDLTERKRREQRIQLLMQEVNHRAKNMLSVVQSIARATAGDEGQEFAQKFEQRIQALSANQSLLISHEWKGIALDELVRSQMAPFADMLDNRIKLSGPPIIIKASASQSLAMALHELATNAGKYGALSASEGVVHIAWHLEPEQGRFKLAWRETGGPEVAPPSRSGFGSVVIGNMIRMNLRADVRLDYAPSGVVWELESPRGHCLESGGEVAHIVEEIGSAKPKASGEAQRRILVVEDEALVGMALAEELRRAGYQVLGPTGSVSVALALLREGCEAAILDVNLGDETSEPIAEKLSREQTPFLAVSGYEHAQLPPAFQNAPLLSKPVRPDIVAKEIDRYLVDGVASEH
ncbi:PAS domain S-box protein [Dichotomicrobium thermohalophilum]|uniref:Blue-light-activated histidine kinase n=1 Tax=Dichotomicrobium thermohalophilum TaxID=933063 RepID=A0A397PFF3_9HYPH|nr:PAS domain S-box protein [Dichotomicrobium thermohalophilum]RIA47688.1 PAS domain S-box-containing protein [Dichotomicrobium thermohalophilum]